MADKKMVGSRLTIDDARETWSRVKAKKYIKGRKQSPCSRSYRKDFETPKRTLKNRFNGCSTGDSPSEAEALQDIIWDPASPPPIRKGKGAGELVEISDIVERIAPHNEKPMDRDLVLQWIGDSSIPCTPEILVPRVRRISTRRQSNNVEDLMKLAKQFDINMDKQRQQDSDGRNTEELKKLEKSTAIHPVFDGIKPFAEVQTSVPVKTDGLSHEEELHALFDGPTQHLSGRLSPPSVSSSQECRNEPKGLRQNRSDSFQVPMPDFDDDWEDDDLLNDSFVLQMTQNPELLSSAPKKSVDHIGSVASKKCEPTGMASSSGSCSRADCSPQLQTDDRPHYTGILSKAQCAGTSRTTPNALVNIKIKAKKPENCPAQTSPGNQQKVVTTMNSDAAKREIGREGVGVKQSDKSYWATGKEFKTLDSVWSDGEDDDLLYQACDDMEQISSSQEHPTENSPIKLLPINVTASSPKAPSAVHVTPNKTAQAGLPIERKHARRIFGRSHSIPGDSTAFGNKLDLCETSQMTHSLQSNGQYKLKSQWNTGPQGQASMHGPSAESSSISHHSTFKRHQSDPMPLGNKVFVAAQPVVKCSAAEIEKKKQEAIARRRLRLQANE